MKKAKYLIIAFVLLQIALAAHTQYNLSHSLKNLEALKTEVISKYDEFNKIRKLRLYETPRHLVQQDTLTYTYDDSKTYDDDYALVEYDYTLKNGDFVYIPTIGLGVVSNLDETKFEIIDIDMGRIYNKMSGIRVLSSDMRYVVGFISRVENGKLVALVSSH